MIFKKNIPIYAIDFEIIVFNNEDQRKTLNGF